MSLPTPAQQEIMRYLANGWELGVSQGWRSNPDRYWLQEGKIGHGGKSKKVNAGTARRLIYKTNYLKQVRNDVSSKAYQLSNEGLEFAKEYELIGSLK